MIAQSPEQREKSRRILLPWLVRLRRWRTKRQAKRFSERQARMLKAHAKQSAKIARKIEKTRLRLVSKPDPIVAKNFVRESRAHPFNPETRVGKHLWK